MRCLCSSYAVLLSRNRMRGAIAKIAKPGFINLSLPVPARESTLKNKHKGE